MLMLSNANAKQCKGETIGDIDPNYSDSICHRLHVLRWLIGGGEGGGEEGDQK